MADDGERKNSGFIVLIRGIAASFCQPLIRDSHWGPFTEIAHKGKMWCWGEDVKTQAELVVLHLTRLWVVITLGWHADLVKSHPQRRGPGLHLPHLAANRWPWLCPPTL